MNIADKEQRIACFFAKLDAMLDITAQQLHERMEFQKTAFAKQFPLLMSALWMGCDKLKPNDDISSVINQGTLASASSAWQNVWWRFWASIMENRKKHRSWE